MFPGAERKPTSRFTYTEVNEGCRKVPRGCPPHDGARRSMRGAAAVREVQAGGQTRQEAGGRRQANITLILNTNTTLAYNKFLAYEAEQGRATKDLYLSVYLKRRFVVTHGAVRRRAAREGGWEGDG